MPTDREDSPSSSVRDERVLKETRNRVLTNTFVTDELVKWDGKAFATSGIAISGGGLVTDGGLQTFGANDSGGAGYRLVRVPNV